MSNPPEQHPFILQLLAVVGEIEAREIMSVADWYEERGRQAGLEKGRDEGARLTLLRQLRRRFGPLPDRVVVRVNTVDAALLEVWIDLVVTETTLDEVLRAR
ncbi:MAG: DUF4351 domain-containing protein [Byssovorax sp.]